VINTRKRRLVYLFLSLNYTTEQPSSLGC